MVPSVYFHDAVARSVGPCLWPSWPTGRSRMLYHWWKERKEGGGKEGRREERLAYLGRSVIRCWRTCIVCVAPATWKKEGRKGGGKRERRSRHPTLTVFFFAYLFVIHPSHRRSEPGRVTRGEGEKVHGHRRRCGGHLPGPGGQDVGDEGLFVVEGKKREGSENRSLSGC